MPEETELKLSVRPEHAARIKKHPLVRQLRSGRARTSRVVGTYYDTPDLLLSRQALTLRLRDANHRRVQTLKRMGPGRGPIVVRDEWEHEVNGRVPNIDAFEDEDIRRFFAETGAAESLHPLFKTDVQRTLWTLRDKDAEIELALDIGEIRSEKGSSTPVCEAELELKSGDPRRLIDVALALNERIDCTVAPLSKAARGYALCRGEPVGAVKASALALRRGATVWQAFVEISRNCLAHLEANDPVARAGIDPEGIHQARVAIRRLRAAFQVFKAVLPEDRRTHFVKELRWLQKQLGDARDLDVFMAEMLTPLQARLPKEAALRQLKARVERARHEAYGGARDALMCRRYGRLRLELERWFLEPVAPGGDQPLSRAVRSFAKRSIRKAHEKIMAFDDHLQAMSDAELHALRIRGKQARYCVEFFASIFPERAARRHGKALAALQDCLGALNDGVVAREILKRLDSKADPLDPRVAPYVSGWFAGRIHDERGRLEKIWPKLSAVEAYWD
jgi:inorganic triphosphatase YgiF